MSFSEKWQSFLDKVNNRIPIKKITQPLDKIFPLFSFVILILIILVILYFVIPHDFLSSNKQSFNDITIKIADNNGSILSNLEFSIKNIYTNSEKTYFTEANGSKVVTLDSSSDYMLIVQKQGYELFEKKIDLTQPEFKVILSIFNLPDYSKKTLSFIDSLTTQVIYDELKVMVRCENGELITPSSVTIENGNYSFDVPSDCGNLYATVEGLNYFVEGTLIPENQSVVNVSKRNISENLGDVKLTIKSGISFLDDITVNLFEKDDLVNPIRSQQTNWASVKFNDLPVGEYRAVANDPNGRYLSNNSDFTIIKDDLINLEINMVDTQVEGGGPIIDPDTNQEITLRTITATILDLESGLEITDPLINPTITLLEDGNQTIDIRAHTQGFTFNIDANKEYSLKASVDGYIPQVKVVTKTLNTYTFNLEKKTISNVSKIKANVYDEDGLVVNNAKVLIYDAVTGYIDVRFNFETTDVNGDVLFEDIPIGNYFLKVKKNYLEGDSSDFNHTPPVDSNLEVSVEIGRATVQLAIKNSYGDNVSDCEVSIFSSDGNFIGKDFSNSSGIFSKLLKADKKIYLKVNKEGYMPYFTDIIELKKDGSVSKQVVLYTEYSGEVPLADYLGVYNTSGSKVESLKNNEVFYFKFRIVTPISKDRMGFVFRVGSKNNVSDDIVYIKAIVNSLGVPVYYANNPFDTSVASGNEAKLVDLLWSDITPGVYELSVPVRVRNAAIGDMIPVYFKSYISNSGSLVNISTYQQYQYYIEAENLCTEVFCFSGQFLDVKEDLRYDIASNLEIPMLINSDYKLEYSLKNAKTISYDNARMIIKNTDLSNYKTEKVNIRSYEIEGVFNDQGYSNNGEENFKIPFDGEELTAPTIPGFSETNFNLEINPLYVGQTKLLHTIVSEQEVIYDLGLNLLSNKIYDMTIDYEPKNILPNINFDMLVKVKDASGNPVEGATIDVYQKMNNYMFAISVGKLKTDSEGKVNILMPAVNLGEIIVIRAHKSSYVAKDLEIPIVEEVVSVTKNGSLLTTDSPLLVNVHKNDFDGTVEKITINNKSNYDLVLDDFITENIYFKYSSLLALGKTLNYLNTQISGELVIPANSSHELSIKIVPSQDAKNLVETEILDGVITGYLRKGSSRYAFDIPIKTKISVGSGVYSDNCLIAEGFSNPWKSVINGGGSQQINFVIKNNCRLKENPEQVATLKNIRAKIVSSGDRYGYYDLMIGQESIRLTEGIYKSVVEDVEADRDYSAVLSYNAAGTKFGEIKTKVYLNAQIETDEGLVYVNNGAGEELLEAEIKITEISECFDFYSDDKEISPGGMFVIDSGVLGNEVESKELIIRNSCSESGRFKVTLCPNKATNYGCQELKFENGSGYQQNEITFGSGEIEKIVGVKKPDVPGAYTLEVLVEALDNNDRAIASVTKPLKVNVKDQLWMDDPFFEVNEDINNSYVTSTKKLYNNNLKKTPWDYSTQKAGDGFSKFMSDGFDSDSSIFAKMLFNEKENLVNANGPGFGSYLGTSIGAGAAATITVALLIGLKTIIVTGSIVPPFGWILAGTAAIAMLVTPIFISDYDIQESNRILDVSDEYTFSDFEQLKVINLNNYELEEEYLNIFDVTGARYTTYLNKYVNIKGKLAEDKTLNVVVPKCNYQNSVVEEQEYILDIINTSICSNLRVDEAGSNEDYTNFKIDCDGSIPRKKVNAKFNIYSICNSDETVWPEQAGIKPITFVIDNSAYDVIKNSSRLSQYKTYDFYPTLNDSLSQQDLAFKDSQRIGKYRVEFHLPKTEEKPNVDLNVYSCMTDSDKFGFTGPGAVPEVNLDWKWDLDNIYDCEDNYCDATQLTQVILNRIDKAKKFIEQRNVQCPKSNKQVADEALEGTYQYVAEEDGVTNEIPLGKVGISDVRFGTEDNQFIVHMSVENRTNDSRTGTVTATFENYPATKVEIYNHSTGEFDEQSIANSYEIITPSGEDNFSDIIFRFGSNAQKILDENISLSLNYTGAYSEYNSFSTEITLENYKAPETSGCKVPAMTLIYNGIDFIDMWFNANQYPENVTVNGGNGWSQEDISTLRNLLKFKAKLITDNYNINFKNDFDRTYGGKASIDSGAGVGEFALMSSPGMFNGQTDDGYLSKLFINNLNYSLKYSGNQEEVTILTPGLYDIDIDFIFGNDGWKMVNNNKVDLNSFVTFSYVKGPETSSAFYRLPFNGLVGYADTGYNRQGYGLAYSGNDDIIIGDASQVDQVRSYYDKGSNPFKYLNIEAVDNIFKINSEVGTRGNILKITSTEDIVNLIFSPSVATPVLMSVKNSKITPFEVYYKIMDNSNNTAVYGEETFTRWTGVGQGCDLSGEDIYSSFNNTFDHITLAGDPIKNGYKLEWPNVNYQGKVYLRSIIYTPYNKDYSINVQKQNGIDVSLDPSSFGSSGKASQIKSINNIFEKIKSREVCVTNSADGTVSEFWWNPEKIYDAQKHVEAPDDAFDCN